MSKKANRGGREREGERDGGEKERERQSEGKMEIAGGEKGASKSSHKGSPGEAASGPHGWPRDLSRGQKASSTAWC